MFILQQAKSKVRLCIQTFKSKPSTNPRTASKFSPIPLTFFSHLSTQSLPSGSLKTSPFRPAATPLLVTTSKSTWRSGVSILLFQNVSRGNLGRSPLWVIFGSTWLEVRGFGIRRTKNNEDPIITYTNRLPRTPPVLPIHII
jgi:hypothetical protein